MTDDASLPERPDSGPGGSGAGSAGDGGADAGRGGLIGEVGRQLVAMRRDLDALAATVRSTTGTLAETVPRVEDLDTALAALRGRVDELAEAVDAGQSTEAPRPPYTEDALAAHGLHPAPGHQVDWHLMSAEQARAAWPALAAWVAAVPCGRLGMTRGQLPDCWPLHPDAVAELSWAHQVHRLLTGPRVGPMHIAEWHTRWLPHLRTRLAAAIPQHDPSRDGRLTHKHVVVCRVGHWHRISDAEHAQRDRDLEHAARSARHPGGPDQVHRPDRDHQRLVDQQHRYARFQDALARTQRDRRPGRARYFPPTSVADIDIDAAPHEQLAHPGLWLGHLREVALDDLAARARLAHHHPAVALDLEDHAAGSSPRFA